MSRRQRRAIPVAPEPDAGATAPLEGRLVGYRLLRRIASGERADVYLAADARAAVRLAERRRRRRDATTEPRHGGVPRSRRRRASSCCGSTTPTCRASRSPASSRRCRRMPRARCPGSSTSASLDDGRCCLVVERLGGPALSRIIAERTLGPGEAVTILAPVVAAIAELARIGFVHVRLAASDVLLDDVGRPRLVGLGALQRLPADGADRVALLRSGHEALARPPRRGRVRRRSRTGTARTGRVPARAPRHAALRSVRDRPRTPALRGGRPRTGARHRGAGSPGPPSRPHHGSAAARHGVRRADAGTRARARVRRAAAAPRSRWRTAPTTSSIESRRRPTWIGSTTVGGGSSRSCVVGVVRWASARWWAAPRSS